MVVLREQTIEKIAQTLYFNFEKVERGTVPDCNWRDFPRLRLEWKLKVEKLLELLPELAIVNRNVLIDFAKYDIMVEQAKEIMNDGWVKEVKE
jgi:hypothetical protein